MEAMSEMPPPLHAFVRLYGDGRRPDERFRLRVAGTLNSFLYTRYSSSQSYFYSKAINQITTEVRTSATLLHAEMVALLRTEQLGKRYYPHHEGCAKLELLIEYYKYHEDVPRLFMQGLAAAIHNYYDKKRRINYIRITKLLKGRVDPKVRIHDSDTSSVLNGSVASSLLHFLPAGSGGRAVLSRSSTILDLQDVFEKAFETAPPVPQPLRVSEASAVRNPRVKCAMSRSPVELKNAFKKPRQLDITASHQTRTLPHNQRLGPFGAVRPFAAIVDSHRPAAKAGRLDFGHLRSAKFKKFIQQERTLHCGAHEGGFRTPGQGPTRREGEEQRTLNVRRASQCPTRPPREIERQNSSVRRLMLAKSASKPAIIFSSHEMLNRKPLPLTSGTRSPLALFQTKRGTYDDLFNTHKHNFRTFAAGLSPGEGVASFGTLGVQSLFAKKRSLHEGPVRTKLEQSVKQKICRKNAQLQLNLLERTVSNSRARISGDLRTHPPRPA